MSRMLPLHVAMEHSKDNPLTNAVKVLLRAYPEGAAVEVALETVVLQFDGSPPQKRVVRWSPYQRAADSGNVKVRH